MVIDYLDPTPNYRLQQIRHTLKTVHGVELPRQLSETHINHLISKTQQEQKSLVENSSFNSYLNNPEYIKSMLILEALRMQLREVSPGRKTRSKTFQESQETAMTKEQQRLAFAQKLEQFATHVIPPSKTGKLSNEEKLQQEQRDLFIVALQTIADKLQHMGTAWAKEQATQLTTLERDIIKLMRHAEQAGMLDNITPKIKNRIVNKGVELYGPALIAQRQEVLDEPEIRRGDWEVDKEIEKEKEQPMDKKAKKSVKETDMLQARRLATPEGNEFTQARLQAIKHGKSHFQVGGKTYPVKGDTRDELAQVDETVLDEMHDSLEFDMEVSKDPHTDVKHYEYQASMSRSELYRNAKYAMSMMNLIQVNEEVEPWIAGALTKAANYLDKIYHYLDYYKTFEPEQLPEDLDGDMDLGETSGSVTRQNLMMIVEYSTKLFEMIKPGDHLEGWVAMKLTTASECISSAKHYLDYKQFEMHALDDHFSDARAGKSRHLAEQRLRRAKIMEQQDLAQAETLLAAKDLSNQLQQTAEKIAKMSVEDLMPLVDVMREQFGPEAAQGFNDSVKASLEALLNTTTETKDQIDSSIDTLQQGGVPGEQAEQPEPGVKPADMAEPTDDETELQEPPVTTPEEPLGRSKKSDLAEAWDDDWGSEDQDMDGNAYEMGYRAGLAGKSSLDNPFEGKDEFRAGEWEDGYNDGRKEGGIMESRKKCQECGTGMYEARKGKMTCNKCGAKLAETKTKKTTAKVKESLMGANPYELMDYDRLKQKAASDPQARQELARRGPQPTPSVGMKPSVTGVSNPYDIASDQRLQQLAAKGDARANQELQRRKTSGLAETRLQEKAPPGEKAERFIRQNKEKFKKQYGDRWEEVLYRTAWKQFGDKNESFRKNQTQLESVNRIIKDLERQLQEHRASWKLQLQEGTVVDPLNTGYGLEGEVIAGKLQQARTHKHTLQRWLSAYRNHGCHQLQEQVATVREIHKLQAAKKQAPWGLAYQDKHGQQHQKFFESQDNAKLWRDLNAKDIQVIQMFGPRDFDKKIAKLRGSL